MFKRINVIIPQNSYLVSLIFYLLSDKKRPGKWYLYVSPGKNL